MVVVGARHLIRQFEQLTAEQQYVPEIRVRFDTGDGLDPCVEADLRNLLGTLYKLDEIEGVRVEPFDGDLAALFRLTLAAMDDADQKLWLDSGWPPRDYEAPEGGGFPRGAGDHKRELEFRVRPAGVPVR